LDWEGGERGGGLRKHNVGAVLLDVRRPKVAATARDDYPEGPKEREYGPSHPSLTKLSRKRGEAKGEELPRVNNQTKIRAILDITTCRKIGEGAIDDDDARTRGFRAGSPFW